MDLDQGSAVPDLNFTLETSEALIDPLTVTSVRKFELSTGSPDFNFVKLTSEALTDPFPVVSPTSTPIVTLRSPVLVPSLAPSNVTVILCALVTPVRLTVTVVVPLPLLLLTDPVPAVTAASVKVTALGKVKTIW